MKTLIIIAAFILITLSGNAYSRTNISICALSSVTLVGIQKIQKEEAVKTDSVKLKKNNKKKPKGKLHKDQLLEDFPAVKLFVNGFEKIVKGIANIF